jgi:hypothetical protein
MSWGCASIYQLDSRPSGATVFSGTNQIGTTPLELSLDQVTEKLGEGGLIRLEIVGHYPLTVWLPNSKQRINATINLNPLKLANRKSSSKTMVNVSRKKINALTDQMLDFQSKLLKGEKIPSADLVKIVNSNPSLGSAYFLAAMAFLAEKNENEGKNYASKASRLSPLESDFHILLQSQEPKTNAAGNQ